MAMLIEHISEDKENLESINQYKINYPMTFCFPAKIPFFYCKSCLKLEIATCSSHGYYQKEVKEGVLGCLQCNQTTENDRQKNSCRSCHKNDVLVRLVNLELNEIDYLMSVTFKLFPNQKEYKGGFILCTKPSCGRLEWPGQDDDDHGLFSTPDGPNNLKCQKCKLSTRLNDQWRNGCRYCLTATLICPADLDVPTLNAIKSFLPEE